MIFLDCESCGLHGMAVLLQYAVDDGEIHLYNIWKEPVHKTLHLIEYICKNDVCGFNLAFDWFHLCKIYTTFSLLKRDKGVNAYPEDHVDLCGVLEKEARDGPCLRPKGALDLMLHARKGPFQSLMNRDDIRIKRVPTALAWELSKELDARVPLADIYFSRTKNKRGFEKWKVYDIYNEDEEMDVDFKDIVCKFAPSSALKALAVHAGLVSEEDVLRFGDIGCDMYPEERGYAPFALAIGEPGKWNNAWPDVIRFHITHWGYNAQARQYAGDDIKYTRGLKQYFETDLFPRNEWPVVNDDDSVLACMVASVRWRGLKVDLPGITELRNEALAVSASAPKDGKKVKEYLGEVMNETEKLAIRESTKKIILEGITKDPENLWKDHPAKERAQNVLNARRAKKEIEIYDKLLLAGRFHCSFKVIGTKSSRMSGTDGLNPQGINHSTKVRSKFPFAWDDLVLCGGDFSSFEVSLAAAVYNDPMLDEDLKQGKKMAGLFGREFFPDLDYDEIVESDGEEEDYYDKSKRGMYAFFYGSTPEGMSGKIGIEVENAITAVDMLQKRYTGIARTKKRIEEKFCSMTQPNGIGTQVVWKTPADFIESPLGFRRYFTLENKICKALFDLANKPPASWKELKVKVVRRERQQTVGGAVQSALYAAAFNIQATNLRAGLNHEIQCFGSQITKAVQVCVWSFQPVGINEWFVMPFNCHDEIDAPCKREIAQDIKNAVGVKIESFRHMVPLIKMKWDIGLPAWKSKEKAAPPQIGETNVQGSRS